MAARRRRRILALLLACDVVTAAVVALGRAPRWAVAVPVALTLLFLVLCRTQVRREVAPADSLPVAPQDEVAPEVVVDAHRVADFDDEREDTVGVSVAELHEALVPTADGGTLWDPLPVTLPTYVSKPAARRTVRTIDLGAPGTWTSGRTDADAAIAAYAAEQAAGQTAGDDPAARAVNG